VESFFIEISFFEFDLNQLGESIAESGLFNPHLEDSLAFRASKISRNTENLTPFTYTGTPHGTDFD
jgi:hypothetical protein